MFAIYGEMGYIREKGDTMAGKLVKHYITGDWGVTINKSVLHSGRWWVHWLTNQFGDGMTVTEEPLTDIQFVTTHEKERTWKI